MDDDLYDAIYEADLEALAKIKDVNKHDNYYWTPLMYAAHAGNLEMIKLLLSRGARIDTKTPFPFKDDYSFSNIDHGRHEERGWTAMLIAIASGQEEAARFLIEAGADIGVIAYLEDHAIIYDEEYVDDEELKRNKFESVASNGINALMLSAYKGHLELIKYLIGKGIKVDFCNQACEGALYLAYLGNHPDCVQYLTEAGGRYT